MKINLWYCSEMKQWRWTLTDDHRPIIKQESGQRENLRDAMNDVATTNQTHQRFLVALSACRHAIISQPMTLILLEEQGHFQ